GGDGYQGYRWRTAREPWQYLGCELLRWTAGNSMPPSRIPDRGRTAPHHWAVDVDSLLGAESHGIRSPRGGGDETSEEDSALREEHRVIRFRLRSVGPAKTGIDRGGAGNPRR